MGVTKSQTYESWQKRTKLKRIGPGGGVEWGGGLGVLRVRERTRVWTLWV